ncbi:hypothetical protein BGY98DRAFT_992686 [Russula aff. rugulosa BPL654]|nr:hypothetical protein BGY98DRAFT_992686 [Russula aff. rugulosa BPL654]
MPIVLLVCSSWVWGIVELAIHFDNKVDYGELVDTCTRSACEIVKVIIGWEGRFRDFYAYKWAYNSNMRKK